MRREWTTAELDALKTLAPFGARAIADALERSERSVRVKAAELRVSVKIRHGIIKTFSRQGLSEAVYRHLNADTCPRCGLRPIGVKTTGLCGVCHFKAMSAAMRERKAEGDARREYDREKQAAHRRVECDACGYEYSPRKTDRKSDRSICPDCRGESC